jgi:hypothetical protein
MARPAFVAVALAMVLAAAGCGGQTTYAPDKTKTCLAQRGANIGVVPAADIVAQTATGGSFLATLSDNFVTVAFGQTLADAKQLQLAYERFAFKNVQSGLPDVLRRYNNVVTLWHEHPSDSDLALVVGCLR